MNEHIENGKRQFIRHTADLPIDIALGELAAHQKEYLINISFGGISFKSSVPVQKDTVIRIKIPLARPVFETSGKTVWCKRNGDYFDVGVEFTGVKDPFKIRMVQQICHIENYKKKVFEEEGRVLTGEQAALEWIRKFAHCFPKEL
jgi:hypothetical protein